MLLLVLRCSSKHITRLLQDDVIQAFPESCMLYVARVLYGTLKASQCKRWSSSGKRTAVVLFFIGTKGFKWNHCADAPLEPEPNMQDAQGGGGGYAKLISTSL